MRTRSSDEQPKDQDSSPLEPLAFKEVKYYREGERRICFVNFDKFPGRPTPPEPPMKTPPSREEPQAIRGQVLNSENDENDDDSDTVVGEEQQVVEKSESEDEDSDEEEAPELIAIRMASRRKTQLTVEQKDEVAEAPNQTAITKIAATRTRHTIEQDVKAKEVSMVPITKAASKKPQSTTRQEKAVEAPKQVAFTMITRKRGRHTAELEEKPEEVPRHVTTPKTIGKKTKPTSEQEKVKEVPKQVPTTIATKKIIESTVETEEETETSPNEAAVTKTKGRRIRYTGEQEDWLINYINKSTTPGGRKDWVACSRAFLKKYHQDRKAFSLCQKWKELDRYDRKIQVYEKARKDGNPQEGLFDRKTKYEILADGRGGEGENDEVSNDEEGVGKVVGKVGRQELDETEQENDETEEEENEDEDEEKGQSKREEKGGAKPSSPPKGDGERNDNEEEKYSDDEPPGAEDKNRQYSTSGRHKRYSIAEKTWLLAHVAEQFKSTGKRDFTETAKAYTKQFGFQRTPVMLSQKWKEMTAQGKGGTELPKPRKRRRLNK